MALPTQDTNKHSYPQTIHSRCLVLRKARVDSIDYVYRAVMSNHRDLVFELTGLRPTNNPSRISVHAIFMFEFQADDPLSKDKERRPSEDLFNVHDFDITIDLNVPLSSGELIDTLQLHASSNNILVHCPSDLYVCS